MPFVQTTWLRSHLLAFKPFKVRWVVRLEAPLSTHFTFNKEVKKGFHFKEAAKKASKDQTSEW